MVVQRHGRRREGERDGLQHDAHMPRRNVEPHAWLLHVLTELPQRAPAADITDLLPFNFARRQAAMPTSS